MSKHPVHHDVVVQWLEAVRERLRAAPASQILDLDGIDALDVFVSPLMIAAVRELRRGGSRPTAGPVRRLNEVLRQRAYRMKQALEERRARRDSASARPTDVVLWPRDLTHFAGQVPVSEALVDAGFSCEFLACNPKIFRQLRHLGLEPVYTLAAWPSVANAARHDARRRVRQLGALAAETLQLYRDEPVEHDLSAAYWAALAEVLPNACEAVSNARAMLQTFSPKLLIVGNDITLEGRAACLVARQKNVPTATLQHGHLVGNPLNRLHQADRIVAYGDAQRRDLLGMGIDESRVLTCGAPYLDRRPRQTGKTHPDLIRLLEIGPERPWVLVANSGPGNRVSHHQHLLVIEELIGLSNRFPEVIFAVKLHRKDHQNHYREVAGRVGAHRLRIIPDGAPEFPQDIFEWLQGCSAVLTGSSTVAVEAMLMDVPVITMDFCDEIHGIDFIEAGATLHVTSGRELDERLRAVLDHPNLTRQLNVKVAEYLHDSFFNLDGQSAQRTAKALIALVEGQTTEPARTPR